MLSLSVILYLVARTLPRIDDREAGIPSLKTHWLVVYLERFDKRFKFYLEKTLRRSGIIVLKLDNVINRKLNKLKKESEAEATTVFITEVESDTNNKEEEA
jgi:hypothetical protein